MSIRTGIQWCDSTVNPTTGCDGCELWKLLGERSDLLRVMGGSCYAGNYQETRMSKALPALYSSDFTEVRMAPGRMAKAASWSDLTGTARPDKPWLDGMPRVIFVGDMGDIFSKAVSFDYLKAELIDAAISTRGRRHIWMVLTKRPARMAAFARWLGNVHGIGWPYNLWAGTSVTNQKTVVRAGRLCKVPARVRFLSVEPLIEAVSIPIAMLRRMHLVIVGGESGRGARPFDTAWARSIRNKCQAQDVPFFMKQYGANPIRYILGVTSCPSNRSPITLTDSHGGDWDEWPTDDLKIREFPGVVTHA